MAVVHLIAVLVTLSCILAPSAAYTDGEGTYVTSDNVRRGVGWKCWSDYFVVNQGTRPGNWRKASGNLYCTGSSECSFSHMDGFSTCETWSIDISAEAQSKIFSFSVSTGYSSEKCKTAQDTSTCSWSDRQCHCIWARPTFVYQNGYRRDRCNRGHGDKTEKMADFHHEAPSYFEYGCGSKCSDTADNLNLLATV